MQGARMAAASVANSESLMGFWRFFGVSTHFWSLSLCFITAGSTTKHLTGPIFKPITNDSAQRHLLASIQLSSSSSRHRCSVRDARALTASIDESFVLCIKEFRNRLRPRYHLGFLDQEGGLLNDCMVDFGGWYHISSATHQLQKLVKGTFWHRGGRPTAAAASIWLATRRMNLNCMTLVWERWDVDIACMVFIMYALYLNR